MTSAPAVPSTDGGGPRRGETRPVSEQTLPDLLAARVRATPYATALLSDAGEVSFQQLDARANRLAHLLIGLGAGPERVVGVALPRSADAIIALTAVLKAGAVYLPLNPEYPRERLAFMAADASPAVVLTGPGAAPALGDLPGTRVLAWDELDTSPFPESDPTDADRTRPLVAGNALYLIYTSGSTGRPKGVLMPARSLVNLLGWHAERFPCGPGVRTANLSAIGFDMAMHEILAALVHGKCLALPTEQVRRDPVELVRWLRRHEVNELFLPNVLIESLCEAAEVTDVRLEALRGIIQSGEPLALGEGVRRFLHAHPRLRIHNHYGATEMQDATVWTADTEPFPSPAPIGRPLWNVGVYLLDERLRPVPDDTPGELYIAGSGLARGYLDRPALTADRFLPDPFGAPGARMYRTGDMARWNGQGELECLGRSDNQVKLNGFRVELGEVEARLRAHPEVAQAVVLPRADAGGGTRLVGYVLAAGGAQPDPQAVRREVRRDLPAHMVPAAVVVLGSFPLSPNGKIDLLALPEPSADRGTSQPGTPEQQAMADVFADVLGHADVGVDDDFFELGGDSLAAVQLVIRARGRGMTVSTQDVFELGTPRRLATAAESAAAPSASAGRPVRPLISLNHAQLGRIQSAQPDVEQILPVSALQQGLLFHRLRTGEDRDAYAEQVRLRLSGPLDGPALRSTAQNLVARHEALRAAFFTEGVPEPVQLVVPDAVVPWEESDLSRLDPADAAREADRLAASDRLRPFDVAVPPLLRCRLVRLAPQEHELLVDFHHVLLDGWSVTLLVRELFALHEDSGALPSAPSIREWLRALRSRDHDAAIRAWRGALEGIKEPALLAPAGRDVPTRDAARHDGEPPSQRCTVDLPPRPTEELTALCRQNRLTLNTVASAMWGVLLGAETGTADVVFGSTDSGRTPDVPDVEELVGMLVNTVPVAVRVRPDETVLTLLRRMQDEQQRLAPHQHLGLGALRRLMDWPVEFDTLMVFENPQLQLSTGPVGTGLRITDVDISDDTHYAVSLLVTPGRSLRLSLTYRPGVIAESRARSLGERLRDLLAAVADNPHRRVGDLPAAGAGDRAASVSPAPGSTRA